MSSTDTTFAHHTGVQVSTLPEAFQQTVTVRPSAVAIRTADGKEEITWRQYAARVRSIAAGLAALGINRGDCVAIMLTNRPEFHLVDTALLHLGAVPFSIYNTSSVEQIEYLFSDAGNSTVITEQAFAAVFADPRLGVEAVVTVDGAFPGAIALADVENSPQSGFDFESRWRAVDPGDLATIIYTSGTTGPPKGVELSHRNIIAELASLRELVDIGFDDRLLSYLPAAHVADRVSTHSANLVRGIQINCVADPSEIGAALADVRPTFFFGVPRVWQKIRSGIEAKLAEEKSPVRKRLAKWALDTGLAVAKAQLAGHTPTKIQTAQHRAADALVLSKVRAAIGMDRLTFAGSGAASVPAEVLEFFLGLGIPVIEVWGMSETTGVSTMTTADNLKIGTVGKPIGGVEVRLASDGELLVRGPVVMTGYRGRPDKTAETIDQEGWLSTGDIAEIDEQGNVRIVDRKKEIIINEAGKNMSPTNIENAVKAASSLVGQVVAIGDGRPYVSALLVLDPEAAAARAKSLSVAPDMKALVAHPTIVDEVSVAVRAANARLSRVEQIKRFVLVSSAWAPGGEELTPTMKLRRRPIADKYADEIVSIYRQPLAPGVVDVGSGGGGPHSR